MSEMKMKTRDKGKGEKGEKEETRRQMEKR